MSSRTLALLVAALVAVGPPALAQNASTGSTTTTGDAAVSPATPSPNGGVATTPNRPGAGAGVNSGALNNGTTGDTIGTGSGTVPAPAPNPERK
jgi:hypothetical protein